MIIPEHARHNFDPKNTDDKQTALNKLFLLSYDKATRQMQEEQEKKEFDRKYNEIKQLSQKINKTTTEELELRLAIEEFLDEYK